MYMIVCRFTNSLFCRDDIKSNDKDWFYHPVHCHRDCRTPIGAVNKFRFLCFFPKGCPRCGLSTAVCRAEEMAEEPMTLKSVIYGISYNIEYPSQRRVSDLETEFATICKGKLKSCKKRHFFVCIHRGDDHFSNKMMLNRHRYIDGCKGAKHPDRTTALLLPYQDFRPGEGKKVEVLGRRQQPRRGRTVPEMQRAGTREREEEKANPWDNQ